MIKNLSLNPARPRRLRLNKIIREAYRETSICPANLIQPLFVLEGSNRVEAVQNMPAVFRQSIDKILTSIKESQQVGVNSFVLFPVINDDKKTENAEEAYHHNGLIQRAIKEIKASAPESIIITDVALDPYTLHGQDGIIDETGYVINDQTNELLVLQALSHAQAGADIVAPSDMMDGRIGWIRRALDQQNFINTLVLSYACKYASHYYNPFREAVGSAKALQNKDKNTYQLDFANHREALLEAQLDVDEGADILLIKPGLPYLDIVQRLHQVVSIPLCCYQVSGEYTMLKQALTQGILPTQALAETLIAFKRAGASTIITYFATEFAKQLAE